MRLPFRKPGKYSQVKNDNLLTQEKIDELKKSLEQLKNVSRPHMMKEVARLAEMGDFSENFGYQAAKGRLRGINNSILKIEFQIDHAEVIEAEDKGTVQIGNSVTVEASGKTHTFQILGSTETDPTKGIISHNSPMGAALIGKKVQDTVTIPLKNGDITYTIHSIS